MKRNNANDILIKMQWLTLRASVYFGKDVAKSMNVMRRIRNAAYHELVRQEAEAVAERHLEALNRRFDLMDEIYPICKP